LFADHVLAGAPGLVSAVTMGDAALTGTSPQALGRLA
jgi:hypothetical protein